MWLSLTIWAVNKDIKAKENFQTIMVIIFWDFTLFDQIFLSSQEKRSLIISNKHGIYQLPHDFPNNLKLQILGKWKIFGKS